MQVIDTIDAWRKALDAERARGKSVGLVPTMGALHAGHASLIAAARKENNVVGVTIFVNPLQFGPAEDLAKYPRPLEADVALAQENGATYVFAPSVAEMYPRPIATTITVAGPSERWEGPSRPGHFDGVATVVAKLFSQAGPCRAYFGEKDYQQLCVIRRLVADLDIPVDVRACPTVREADGLALSSRNVFLSADDRKKAASLYRALTTARDVLLGGGTPAEAQEVMRPDAELIYAAVVDPHTLEPLDAFDHTARILIAARLGTTRLIDNLGVTR